MENVKVGNCQLWKMSKLENVKVENLKVGKCQSLNVSKFRKSQRLYNSKFENAIVMYAFSMKNVKV